LGTSEPKIEPFPDQVGSVEDQEHRRTPQRRAAPVSTPAEEQYRGEGEEEETVGPHEPEQPERDEDLQRRTFVPQELESEEEERRVEGDLRTREAPDEKGRRRGEEHRREGGGEPSVPSGQAAPPGRLPREGVGEPEGGERKEEAQRPGRAEQRQSRAACRGQDDQPEKVCIALEADAAVEDESVTPRDVSRVPERDEGIVGDVVVEVETRGEERECDEREEPYPVSSVHDHQPL